MVFEIACEICIIGANGNPAAPKRAILVLLPSPGDKREFADTEEARKYIFSISMRVEPTFAPLLRLGSRLLRVYRHCTAVQVWSGSSNNLPEASNGRWIWIARSTAAKLESSLETVEKTFNVVILILPSGMWRVLAIV